MNSPSVSTTASMPFDSAEQQQHAATLGMWVFLASEMLFFGGLIVAYLVYRYEYATAFVAGSHELNLWSGGLMTALLLGGSLLVASSDNVMESTSDRAAARRGIALRLGLAALLGIAFLGLEFSEYADLIGNGRFPGARFETSDFAEAAFSGRAAEVFFSLFFCMTGLHALHMLIGIVLVGSLAVAVLAVDELTALRNTLVVIGLYWHFVDVVWVFLYPMFYLIR
ncbi:MAG: cytochrome c oxidase subunit 3 [Aureliella sp.]